MSSPITFSNFNNIDFSSVLTAIMQQESLPLQVLQARQQTLKLTNSAYDQLSTKLNGLQTAANALSDASTVTKYAAASSDATTVGVSSAVGTGAIAGRYEVVVNQLARAQLTVSATSVADTDTTTVASGGSLTIGGKAVSIDGPVTLQGLADAINTTSDVPATASIVQTAPGAFRLALTAKDTGVANGFSVTNALTGGSVTFGGNAVEATNASVTINNVTVTSTTNTITAGIPGVDLTLQQKDPSRTVVVNVTRDDTSLTDRVNAFISAYNDLTTFASDQATAAKQGLSGTLGQDGVLRGVRSALQSALSSVHGSGDFTRLAEVGIGFNRTGQLTLDSATFQSAIQTNPAGVTTLFSGTDGAFNAVNSLVKEYTDVGGFLPGAESQINDELTRLGTNIDDVTARLAVRRTALQAEFTAADLAISRLNSQSGSISSLGSQLSSLTSSSA